MIQYLKDISPAISGFAIVAGLYIMGGVAAIIIGIAAVAAVWFFAIAIMLIARL